MTTEYSKVNLVPISDNLSIPKRSKQFDFCSTFYEPSKPALSGSDPSECEPRFGTAFAYKKKPFVCSAFEESLRRLKEQCQMSASTDVEERKTEWFEGCRSAFMEFTNLLYEDEPDQWNAFYLEYVEGQSELEQGEPSQKEEKGREETEGGEKAGSDHRSGEQTSLGQKCG